MTAFDDFKIIPLFFLIDCSGSMDENIDTINNSMTEIMLDFSNTESNLRYAVLAFSSGCRWITGDALQPCTGEWETLEADGLTCFNTACRELNQKLSAQLFQVSEPPVILLLTDGFATDGDADGKDGIAELEQNPCFRDAAKYAIAIGEDASRQLCSNFTGKEAQVFTAYNKESLRGLLKDVICDAVSPDE